MKHNQKTPLMKALLILQTFLLPAQLIILKEVFNFDTLLYFVIAFPYFIYIVLMKVKVDYTSDNIEKLLIKIQELENKLDRKS